METQLNEYTNDSSQIKITPKIKAIADSFEKNGVELIFEILRWIQKTIKDSNSIEFKNEFFRIRTANEIIESEVATGCTDYALAFIALSRTKKIPTKYVEAIRKRWIDTGNEEYIEGHVFAECFVNNNWYIVDPEEGAIKISYQRFIIFEKGMDSWDIGINNIKDLKSKFANFKDRYRDRNQ